MSLLSTLPWRPATGEWEIRVPAGAAGTSCTLAIADKTAAVSQSRAHTKPQQIRYADKPAPRGRRSAWRPSPRSRRPRLHCHETRWHAHASAPPQRRERPVRCRHQRTASMVSAGSSPEFSRAAVESRFQPAPRPRRRRRRPLIEPARRLPRPRRAARSTPSRNGNGRCSQRLLRRHLAQPLIRNHPDHASNHRGRRLCQKPMPHHRERSLHIVLSIIPGSKSFPAQSFSGASPTVSRDRDRRGTRTRRDETATFKDQDLRGDAFDETVVMADEDHGSARAHIVAYQRADDLGRGPVERRSRLVKQQHFGSTANARARHSRCTSPPDSSAVARTVNDGSSPTRASNSTTPASGKSWRPTRTSSSTRSVSNTEACATSPTRRRNARTSSSAMGTPSSVIRPVVGSSSRFSSRSSVDFPAPLAPVTAVQRPAGIHALTSRQQRSRAAGHRDLLEAKTFHAHQPCTTICTATAVMHTAITLRRLIKSAP